MKPLFTLVYSLLFIFVIPNVELQQHDDLSYHEKYLKEFDEFIKVLDSFSNYCDGKIVSMDSLQQYTHSSRLAFKKIEFLLDYYDPKFCYLYINGGPLNKLNVESAEEGLIPPNGLQRLDELVYDVDSIAAKVEVSILVGELLQKSKLLRASQQSTHISNQQLIEALRSSLVRIFSLGLTGFDTPGSGHGLEESKKSFIAMEEMFDLLIREVGIKEILGSDIKRLFREAQLQLSESTSFEDLDRFKFLVEVINPLFKQFAALQVSLGLELSNYKNHAQDYTATNLFEEKFLNSQYYNEFSYAPLENEEAIALGKILFYDPILSRNIDLSCASCHQPRKAFTDGQALSQTNRFDKTTFRNTPTLIDATYSTRYFWDMREYNLERQVAHVLIDSLEFNLSFKEAVTRLQKSEEYNDLFSKAYGNIGKKTINQRSISNAIAAYVNTLKSFNSPFDKYVRGEEKEISADIISGFNLFMGKASCGTCHFAPAFNGTVPPFYIDSESEVLGVPIVFDSINPKFGLDHGRMANGLEKENLAHLDRSFKTVTIRNAELTSPYMHHGGFETLEEVLQFYNLGGGLGMGLHLDNQTLAPDPLNLSDKEQQDIIAFMVSLTDTTGLNHTPPILPKFDNQYWNNRAKPKVFD